MRLLHAHVDAHMHTHKHTSPHPIAHTPIQSYVILMQVNAALIMLSVWKTGSQQLYKIKHSEQKYLVVAFLENMS